MNTMREVRNYLRNEQALARDSGTPEWQVFTALQNLAAWSDSVEQFITDARNLPIDGPPEEAKEARNWLNIALDTIQGQ